MEVAADESYEVKFPSDMLKNVLSNFDADKVNIAPMRRDETDDDGNTKVITIGCLFWTDTLTTLLAGQG